MASSNPLAYRGIKIPFIILMAVGLTITFLRYKQPAHCDTLCTGTQPCQAGQCKFGEQRAGFPITFAKCGRRFTPSGWGKAGLEDYAYASLGAFTLNVACSSLTL